MAMKDLSRRVILFGIGMIHELRQDEQREIKIIKEVLLLHNADSDTMAHINRIEQNIENLFNQIDREIDLIKDLKILQ